MKSSKKFKLISTILFIPVLIVSSFLALNVIDQTSHVAKVHTEVQEWGKFSGINIKIKSEEAKNYSLSISTPTTSSEQINDTIHQWLEAEEEHFFHELKQFTKTFNDHTIGHLNIQLEIDPINDHIYNLIFTTHMYLGGANGENKTKVFTIDLEHENIFSIDDIMPLANKKDLKKFQKTVQKVVANDESLLMTINLKALDEALLSYDQLEWSLHEEFLRLYFTDDNVAPGSDGIVKLDIPLEELTTLIEEEIIDQFQLSVIEDKIKTEQKESKKEKKTAKKKKKEQQTSNKNKQVQGKEKYVALTFDDGPSGTVTPEILYILEEFDVVATFFMLGSQVDYYPDLAAEVANRGHEVANHTQNHIDLTKVRKNVAEQEINLSREKIEKATGQTPKLVRPPYGAYDDTTLSIVSENGESIILWSVDPLDWKNRKPKEIANRVLSSVKPGSIILLHDIHQTTAEALPKILEELINNGYTFVTVSELIELENIDAMQVIRGE